MMPAEDAYWQIGSDASRFWSTAQGVYVPPDDPGYLAWLPTSAWQGPIPAQSEESLSATLTNIGIGHMAPIPPPPPRDPLAEIDALKEVLITNAVITEADVAAAIVAEKATP